MGHANRAEPGGGEKRRHVAVMRGDNIMDRALLLQRPSSCILFAPHSPCNAIIPFFFFLIYRFIIPFLQMRKLRPREVTDLPRVMSQ